MSVILVDQANYDALFKLLRALQPDLSVELALTLVAVAREPGLSINELAERIQVPQQTASRYAAILQGRYELPTGELNSFARTPLLLLEVNAQNSRKRALFLTSGGRERLTSILETETE
jgi:DNA-binding MarR family transcriptional regulator